MIRAVIIEDEPIFQDLLKKAIRNTGLDIHIEGVCGSKRAAKKLIEEVVPQLLFLDVELTDGKVRCAPQHPAVLGDVVQTDDRRISTRSEVEAGCDSKND